MSNSASIRSVDVVGGCVGTGGLSGPPPSAETETANTHANAIANKRLFTPGHSPFYGATELDIITLNTDFLFQEFWEKHLSGEPLECLAVCDRLLEVIPPSDFDSHLRQTNGRAVALRVLCDYRGAYRVHLSARPLIASVKELRLVGCHFHGLGMTLTELGQHVPAYKALETARTYYEQVGDAYRIGLVNVNTARLMVKAGRPALAYGLADSGGSVEALRIDAEIVRALAYEAEGNKVAARRSIASALVLLADSDNEATRREALSVMARIEGGGESTERVKR